MKSQIKYILIFIFFWTLPAVQAQLVENAISVGLGRNKILLIDAFTISVTSSNVENIPTIVFPELKGFEKRGTSRSGTTKIVGGKTVEINTFTQNYYAIKEGVYPFISFLVRVNGQEVRSDGTTIIVGKDNPIESNEEIESAVALENEKLEDAFLTVTVRKRQVYMDEGFSLSLSFLVSENNSAEMDFYETNQQLAQILKQIRPTNCWEENFNIKEILPIPITVRGKRFTEYRIYQATFFPLNNQSIKIPVVGLTMKIGAEENIEKAILKTFYSKPIEINVVNLPPHPLKNQISVGNLKLEEQLKTKNLKTGSSYSYDFTVVGEGNIAAIREPIVLNNSLFDVYPPKITQTTNRQRGRVTGRKTFHYQLIPKRNGDFALQNLLELVFFNPAMERYDTLRSALTVQVSGQNAIQNSITLDDAFTSFYAGLAQLDSRQISIDYQAIIKNITNVFIFLMLMGMIFIFRKNG